MTDEGLQRDLRPIPDPTVLTTEALRREVAALNEQINREIISTREYIELQIKALRELIEMRFAGNDKAVELLQVQTARIPNTIDDKFTAQREITSEKFASIQVQFMERDVRAEQTSKDSKTAVDAALQAAKEANLEQNKSSALAIAKSDASIAKQIDQLNLLIQTTARAGDEKNSDLKDRVTRLEGKNEGSIDTKTQQQSASSYMVAVVGLIIGTLIAIAGFFLGKR